MPTFRQRHTILPTPAPQNWPCSQSLNSGQQGGGAFFLLLAALLCCVWLPQCARADTPAPPSQMGVVALGHGQVMEASPPRQLSLHAQVQQFAYQPGGLGIAYAGASDDGDTTTQYVKMVGTRQGTTTTLLAQTGPPLSAGDAVTTFDLVGWSADARFLVATQYRVLGTSSTGEPISGPQAICVDVGASPPQVRLIALPMPLPPDVASVFMRPRWSPRHTRLLLQQTVVLHSNKPSIHTTALYDFARDHVDVLPITASSYRTQWVDENRLSISDAKDPKAAPRIYNVATEKTGPPAAVPARPTPDPHQCPTRPAVILDTQTQAITDPQRAAAAPAHVIWVRRTSTPRALSALAVDVVGGKDDPQAAWAQTGQQVAYIAHGDLFVADLTVRDATLKEKYVAGEPLTCAEERTVAMQSLKDTGLAIIQYVQDHDEQMPTQASVNTEIAPYLPPDALLQVGDAKFVYHAPADLALSAMDAPATTVLGTMDLPCAHIALYADGHVKAYPKDAAPTP